MNKIFEKIRYSFLIVIYITYVFGFYMKSFLVPIIEKTKGEEAAELYKHKVVQKWCKFTFKIIDVNIQYEGANNIPNETCLFVGNHQGILDIPALMMGANRTIGFIAKKEMLKVPIANKWIMSCHSVAIDREDARDAVRVIKEGVANLKNGYSMGIYPEGTRATDGKIGEFKQGSLKLALRAKVPIIPVTVDGSYKAYELNKKFESTTIKVTYGEPIYVDKLTKEEQKDLAKIIQNIIEKKLEK